MTEVQNKTILLVEDEIFIALMEKKQLESEGYTVIHSPSGEQALACIKENKESINLILMDIDLGPGMDGTETAIEILKIYDIPILFLSSRVEKETLQRTEKITSYGYVVKNSGITVLDASIKMAFKLFEANKITQKQKEQLSAILYSIGDAVIVTDKDGKISSLNPIAEKLTGWNLEESKGRDLKEIFHIINAHTRQEVDNPVKTVLATGQITGLANHTILISKKGKEFQIADSGSPIRDQNGNIIGVVLVFRDVTQEYLSQRQIENSERKYSTLFNKAGIPAAFTKLPENYFLDINESFENIFGYKKKEVIGKTSVELGIIRKEMLHQTENAINSDKNSYEGEREIITKSGEVKTVLIHVSKVKLDNIDYAITTIYDITERRKFEKLISYQASMLENVNDAVIATDANFIITYWNNSAEKIYGWKANEAIGKIAPELLKTNYVNKKREEVVFAVSQKGKFFGVFIQERSDGTKIYIEGNVVLMKNDQDTILGYISVNRDVTQRIEMEQKQKASEARLNGIVESAMDAIICLDRNEKIILFNSAAENMFGYSAEKMLGQTLDELIPTRFREKHSKYLKAFTRNTNIKRKNNEITEIIGLNAKGEEFLIETSLSKIDLGTDLILTAIIRDITARKLSEKKINTLLEEKEIILKEVHHRIKNNMLTILGLLTLQSDRQDNPAIKNILLDAASRVKSMMILYDKLYHSTDNRSIAVKGYLPAFIKEIVNIFYIVKPIKIETDIDDIILTPAILSPLGIILNELITNTMKYSIQDQSEIIIKLITKIKDRLITISYEDNGVGIPENISFENSSGFGLQLIHMLAFQINGKVYIDPLNRCRTILEIQLQQ